jgi:hypothetical protein
VARAGIDGTIKLWPKEGKGEPVSFRQRGRTARLPREAIDQVVSSVPLGRIAEADEMASAAFLLASDESAIAVGRYGSLPVMDQVKQEAHRRKIDLLILVRLSDKLVGRHS